jgi:hypothetical protein
MRQACVQMRGTMELSGLRDAFDVQEQGLGNAQISTEAIHCVASIDGRQGASITCFLMMTETS